MFQKLVSHNDDLRRLVEKDYAVAIDSNYLVVRDIPYLSADGALRIGGIVTKLEFVDANTVRQDDHQIFFAGSSPHNLDGSPIPNLADRPATLALSEACSDVVVQRMFSNKPKAAGKFADFFEKIESYVAIISGPAMELATPYTGRTFPDGTSESVFSLPDTLTSRAEIGDLSAKFRDEVVAVIGTGGTGAYVLDLLVKTPVREIRAYDDDFFHVHNSFRSPGKFDPAELGKKKAAVYEARYSSFRRGMSFKAKCIDATSGDELDGVTFAFVCVDKGSARSEIFEILLSKKIPFIDVGMGLSRKKGVLNGMLRTTYFSSQDGRKIFEKGLAKVADDGDDLYKTNIQIGELNALNACLAVIRFKQVRGFYFEENPVYNLLFEVGDFKIVEESELKDV